MKRQVQPARPKQHRALARARLEARAPVIRAHAALGQSAEWQSRANRLFHHGSKRARKYRLGAMLSTPRRSWCRLVASGWPS